MIEYEFKQSIYELNAQNLKWLILIRLRLPVPNVGSRFVGIMLMSSDFLFPSTILDFTSLICSLYIPTNVLSHLTL